MTAILSSQPQNQPQNIAYPTGDGQPIAETFDPLYAILITIELSVLSALTPTSSSAARLN